MSVYKYVTADRIDILQNACIRFTPPQALNDPFEMKPYFDTVAEEADFLDRLKKARTEITEEALQKTFQMLPARMRSADAYRLLAGVLLTSHPPEVEAALEGLLGDLVTTASRLKPELRELMQDSVDKQIGILCLSEKPDNLLMWAHYAQNYTGFVLEFDETHPFFQQRRFAEDETGYLRKVVYSDERPARPTMMQITATDLFLTKAKEWEYEQEWRMLRLLADADSVHGPVHLFALPPTCIRGVIYGCKMGADTKLQIDRLITTDPRYSHLQRYTAVLSEARYALNLVPDSPSCQKIKQGNSS